MVLEPRQRLGRRDLVARPAGLHLAPCQLQSRAEIVAQVRQLIPVKTCDDSEGRRGWRSGRIRRACACVCPAKAGVFSGSQSHRGKSQRPRSLDSSQEGNLTGLKPIDKAIVKDGERVSGPQHVRTDRLPREEQGPMAEPKEAGRRQDGVTHLADASGHIGGVTPAARRQRTRYATGEARLVPERKPLEGALSYNRRTREIDRRRAGGGWVRSSDDAG